VDSHALKVLEYGQVLRLLQARVPSSLGRTALAALSPSSRREVVLERQRQTTEMRTLRERHGDLPWAGSGDISGHLERLKAEDSWIEPRHLYCIAEFITAALRVKEQILSSGDSIPVVARIAAGIPELGELGREIKRCVNSEGEVFDNASPELARVRKSISSVRREVMAFLEGFFREGRGAEAIQEKIITQRNGRYVIPVKAGSRTLIPGLVHDRSASGLTLYLEPHAAVEKNNSLRELVLGEKAEVRKVLQSLSGGVRGRDAELRRATEVMAELEAIWARAVYSGERDMVEPEVFEEGGRLRLRGAEHPLLQETLGEGVVPIDVEFGGENRTLVLTGPNTGGKTAALKTVGLLCLMAQSGLHLPASPGSGLSCFPEILADIGDEQSLEQNLSTFSGHMKNIIALLEKAAPEALVLLDELGAGTEPQEGAAIGIAILEEVQAQGATAMATTHHNAVKVYASTTPGVANASMEFDGKTLQPTYRLVMGVPGRSQAFAVAAHLGLREETIRRAQAHQTHGEVQLDDLMADLEGRRAGMGRERASLTEARRRLDEEEHAQQKRWKERHDRLSREARQVIREAERELHEHLRTLRRIKSPAAAQGVKSSLQGLRNVLEEQLPGGQPQAPPVGRLSPGDQVFLKTVRAWGTVEEVGKDTAVVQVGDKRCTISLAEAERRESSASPGRGERPFTDRSDPWEGYRSAPRGSRGLSCG
jgi:DNA mismatch repair protein MutS2